MNVLGISGLANSAIFKQEIMPELTAREYRLAQGADAAAAIVVDGDVVAAAAQERFSRVKGTYEFPLDAIEYCLDAAGLTIDGVDCVAHNFDYEPYADFFRRDSFLERQYTEVYSRDALLRFFGDAFPSVDGSSRLVRVPHHVAHAASAFYLSGFDDAAVMVADGIGEFHSTTTLVGSPKGMELIRQVPGRNSIGLLYGLVTLYLGFFMNFDEYKVMGLAPYGDPETYLDAMRELVQLESDGAYRTPIVSANRTLAERETYSGTLAKLEAIFGPPREPESEIDRRHKDIAAALQQVTEETVLHLLRQLKADSGLTSLCMAGGVALNCTANAVVRASGLFDSMFVQPAAGDDGTALGAALHVYHETARQRTSGLRPHGPKRMGLPMWGPEFPDGLTSVSSLKDRYDVSVFESDADMTADVARRLFDGNVIAWFQGRMEFGPRALGSRSILADPRDDEMRDRINAMVKKREAFRPFAPIVSEEACAEFFETAPGDEKTYAHMLFVAQVREDWRARLPAVTHVDGTARLQTVSAADSPLLWQLLTDFCALTGIPVLLNTSLNVRGQPIVCTPEEALDVFESTKLEVLVVGRTVVTKR